MNEIRRAWLEINLTYLAFNINLFRQLIPKNTQIIAVVKADAYHLGAKKITEELITLGISFFAVATLEEAIILRKINKKIDILILGFTEVRNADLLFKYDLIQTIVDYDYALALNQGGFKIKCHLKIDTGMHRLGIDAHDFKKIEEVYSLTHLDIRGIYSHLSVSNSLKKEDIAYSKMQIKRFNKVLKNLAARNINYGKSHLQSTYGILNYPELSYDYVRLGTGMYGIKTSKDDDIKLKIKMKSILTYKCLVASVKTLAKGSFVSYGNTYQANAKKKIAILNVGYADGIKQSLSNHAYVFIHQKKAKIIGKICLDQMIVDITGIDNVCVGDIVLLINDKQAIEDIAYKSGVNTTEFLMNINERVKRVYLR